LALAAMTIASDYCDVMIHVRNRVAGVTRFCDVAILGCLAKK
jgi:hypothetical protein